MDNLPHQPIPEQPDNPARRFQVLEQTSSARCEICHQADRFDPFTETCMRCQALILTHTLPEEEAERYQRRQQAALNVPRDKKVPVDDLFRVLPEAAKLCWRNFPLFFGIIAGVQIPAHLFSFIHYLLPATLALNPVINGVTTFLSILMPILLSSVAAGALTKAILDRYRGEQASFWNSYKFILERGWSYLFTAFMGFLFQAVGAVLCLLGLLYTFPRGAFVSEVAIVEEKYYLNAFRRSSQLGSVNIWMILLFGLIWVSASSGISIFVGSLSVIGMMLSMALGKGAIMLVAILSQVFNILGNLVIMPFFLTVRLMLYFHLRMRTEDVEFPQETGKKGEIEPAPLAQ